MSATKAAPTKAGTHGTIGALPIGGKVSSDHADDMDAILGTEIEGPKGTRFRLVRLNKAAGIAAPGRRTFVYTSETGYDVDMSATANARICGVATKDQVALVDNDYFWLQVDGVVELIRGDDGTNIAAGDHVANDDDADEGKVKTVTTNVALGTAQIRALEAENSVDGTFLAQILVKLVG